MTLSSSFPRGVSGSDSLCDCASLSVHTEQSRLLCSGRWHPSVSVWRWHDRRASACSPAPAHPWRGAGLRCRGWWGLAPVAVGRHRATVISTAFGLDKDKRVNGWQRGEVAYFRWLLRLKHWLKMLSTTLKRIPGSQRRYFYTIYSQKESWKINHSYT